MFFTNKVAIDRINYRISLLRARGEEMNKRLINALLRERRNLEE